MNQQEEFERLGSVWSTNLGNPKGIDAYEKLKRLPRANRHCPTCNCEACQSIRKKEGGVLYAVRVPVELKKALKLIGAKKVRAVLVKLAKGEGQSV